MSKCLLLIVGLLVSNSLISPVLGQATSRTWHAATGGFSVEAELTDVRDGKVRLKKADGATVWVDLSKLSLADIRYVEDAVKKAAENLQQEMAGNESGGDSEPGEDSNSSQPNISSRSPTRGSSSGNSSPFAGMRDVNLVLGAVSEHDLTFPTLPSTWLIVQRQNGGAIQYQAANIRTGKSLNPFLVEGYPNQKALSPDGALFAVAMGFPTKIGVFSTATGKRVREIELPGNASMSKMAFVSSQQIMVSVNGMQGQVVLYDAKSGRTAKQITLDSGFFSKFAISPDGRLLAAPGPPGTIGIYDLRTGKRKSLLAMASVSGNALSSVDDLAFCRDGDELVVLGAGSISELHAFSVKTGKPIAQHKLSERLHEICPSYSSYAGPAVEALSGEKGWILYGSAIVDREKGGPVWVDREKPATGIRSAFRVLIDDTKQLALVGGFNAARFEIRELPWSDISATKEMVEKGGTVQDSGLPPIQLVDARKAAKLDDGLNPPLFQGMQQSATPNFKPTALVIPKEIGAVAKALFARTDIGKCIMTPTYFTSNTKSGVLVDLKNGKVEKRFDLSFASFIQDASPDARWIATTTGTNNSRVDIFDTQTEKHHAGFRPFSVAATYVRLANVRLLSNEMLMTVATDNQAVVWKLPELEATYRFKSLGVGYRFPISDRFLHRGEAGWYVRRASDGTLEGILETSDTELVEVPQSVSFQADESACAAILGDGSQQKLVVWNLLTGKRQYEIVLSSIAASIRVLALDGNRRLIIDGLNRQQTEDIVIPNADGVTWCDDEHVLIKWGRRDASRFADPNSVSPIVVSYVSLSDNRILWDYRFPIGMVMDGGPQGQVWFTEMSPNGNRLVGVDLPSTQAADVIGKAPEPTTLLPDGSSLALDVQANISGDKLADGFFQDQLVEALGVNLKAHRIEVSERAGVKLTVRVDQVSDRVGSRISGEVKMRVSCRLTDISNAILWQRDKLVEPEVPMQQNKLLSEDVRRKVWQNTLTWIKQTVDPPNMFERWYYRGLGESLISRSGETLFESYLGQSNP